MAKPRKIVISAGDPSGDLILSRVIHQLKILSGPGQLEFVGLCGPHCVAQGARSLADPKDIAIVGLFEVLKSLPKIFGVMDRIAKELDDADSLLCVDMPDFNLRLARRAQSPKRKRKVPVDYIIAPQVWAWRSERIQVMAQLLRRIYVAFPFEQKLLSQGGVAATFLGHPILDSLPPFDRTGARARLGMAPQDFVICIMPGSRGSEIRAHFATLIAAWRDFYARRHLVPGRKNFRAVIAVAPGWTREALTRFLPYDDRDLLNDETLFTFCDDSRSAMMAADLGWIASGTATLEAACYALPHVLVYRLSRSTAFVLRQISPFFSVPDPVVGLPNILWRSVVNDPNAERIVTELLQSDFNPHRLANETLELISSPANYSRMREKLERVRQSLGESGAGERIASDLLDRWQAGEGSA